MRLLVLLALLLPAALGQDGAADLEALVQGLERADPQARGRALDELLDRGADGALAASIGLADGSLEGRRARSWVLREQGDLRAAPAALEALSQEPDREVRENLCLFLGAVIRGFDTEAGAETDARRAPVFAALAQLARTDPDAGVRLEALQALSRSDTSRATDALVELLDQLPSGERGFAARGLANQPSARERIVTLVQDAFLGNGPAARDDDVLEVLLGESYGADLAEIPEGGASAADRAPFVLGARHPSPGVRRAAQRALQLYLGRIGFLGQTERGVRLLEALIGQGLDDAALHMRLATFALETGDELESAYESLRSRTSLLRPLDGDDGLHHRRAAARSALLEGAIALALDRPEAAREAFERAASLLDAMRAERLDLRGPSFLVAAASVLEHRAVAELYLLLLELWDGTPVTDPRVQERAERTYACSLEHQLLATEGPEVIWAGSIDDVLRHPFGPFALLLNNLQANPLPTERMLEIARQACRALAREAPLELPGFVDAKVSVAAKDDPDSAEEPDEVDPLEQFVEEQEDDDTSPEAIARRAAAARQRVWLRKIQSAFLVQHREELRRLQRELGDSTEFEPRRQEWQRTMEILTLALRNEEDYVRLRMPTDISLSIVNDMREEGFPDESRTLAERLLEQARGLDYFFNPLFGEVLIARAEMAIGASWTDEDQPERAEEILLRALERLDAVAAERESRGGSPGGGIDNVRSSVLISLAVNANVKLRDTVKALGYFERAFEIREDDFTRTLLACYRARAGRGDEARALLRGTPVSPLNYYNLACTYALLGETDTALEYLRRDLEENLPSEGSRSRQRTWARDDPDLEALQGDPRFEALVAPR